ncbi:hypothetical protein [Streptomyces sp. MAR4 CNX-425]|uniref:hypothetical protein n=1 Tax=Streptomyces sp. MAR4 CNX-425 TaxID=3406343 RepID=UPI003B50F264
MTTTGPPADGRTPHPGGDDALPEPEPQHDPGPGPVPPPPTLLRVELAKRGWARFSTFEVHYTHAARKAAAEYGDPRLARLTISSTTFKRWLAGEQIPRGNAGTVLEHMLGIDVDALLGPAPTRTFTTPRLPDDASLATARALDVTWSTSFLSPTAPAPGGGGVWQLDGHRVFDGTSVAVQLYEAEGGPDSVVIGPDDHPHLRDFIRPARRALLLAALGARRGDGLFVLDAVRARQPVAADPVDVLPIPRAYRLDDLTYGVLWAVLNLDDGLLADDAVLEAERGGLDDFLGRERSAVARSAMPELSDVGTAWLGSYVCDQHVLRRLRADPGGEPPVFWAREQYGEEAAAWLFFRHKHDYLRSLRETLAGTDGPHGHAFCLPHNAVKTSERYERTLLFLALALLERRGLTTWVCTEPEYAQVDGFALLPGQRAVIANWLRTDGIWQVDTTGHWARLRAYTDAVRHARTHSVTDGATAAERLRRLADHLDLDWRWLTARCAELGRYGSAGMLRPRSRLIGLEELDDVLRFVGELGEVGGAAGDGPRRGPGRDAVRGDFGALAGAGHGPGPGAATGAGTDAVTGGNRTQFRPDRSRGGRR